MSAFSDAYRRAVEQMATSEAELERERSWQDLGAWFDAMVINHDPPQDAPALGYMPSLREYIGAVPWTDEAISDAFYINRPPGVMLPSEVTDAVAKWWLRS